MRSRSISLASLLAVAGLGAFVSTQAPTAETARAMPPRAIARESALREIFRSTGDGHLRGYPRRDGWSVREGQRRARKARNRKRHRAACRR